MEYDYTLPLGIYENIHLKGEVNDEDVVEKINELVNLRKDVREKLGLGDMKDEKAKQVTEYTKTNAVSTKKTRRLTKEEYVKFITAVEKQPTNKFIQDMNTKLQKYNGLTDAQINAVINPKPYARKTNLAEEV